MQTVVTTRQGALEGLCSQDGKTVIFRGIPYAEPPIGDLRFRRPQEKKPWEGVLPCREFGPRCPQADLAGMDFYGKEFYDAMVPKADEDCLTLNIWAPADQPREKLPVLFWIHGGAFLHGCGCEKEFDGEGFAKKGVILVSINYRVNVFGFFAHPELEKENPEGVSGNYGILDQIFALKWVRENIAAFGGDPERITIAGQSAGCMSVQSIVSSPLAKGLMKGAILQSGGGLPPLHLTPEKEALWKISQKLMDHLGVTTISALRALPAEALREAAYAVLGGPGLRWTPHRDGWLLPGDTGSLALSGEIHDIAYLIGSNGDDIGGDDALRKAGAGWCENLLKLGRAPGYLYFFNRKLPGDNAGAFHSAELWYEFETFPRCWRPWEPWDKELARILSGYWANFAKNGDPNGPGLPRWEPYGPERRAPLVLADTVGMEA